MTQAERVVIGTILACIAVLISADLLTDARNGAKTWHLLIEVAVALGAMMGVVFVWQGHISLKKDLRQAHEQADKSKTEMQIWRARAKIHSKGLSRAIIQQLETWELSASEKEIAFMLLKGLSLREIANIRSTTEKTARAQATAIYQKASLGGRADLAAFFLEDLLG